MPVLVIHGREDTIRPHEHAEELARASGGRLVLGTWQSICLLDPNPDNAVRHVQLGFLAG